IKDGATLLTSAEAVVNALQPFGRPRPAAPEPFREPTPPLDAAREPLPQVDCDDRGRITAALGPAPVHIDELARATGLPIRIVQTVLLELALAGRIQHHGSQLVSLLGPAG